MGLCQQVVALLGVLVLSGSLPQESENEWQQKILARVQQWELGHRIPSSVAAAARERLSFRERIAKRIESCSHRVDDSVRLFVTDLLDRHRNLLLNFDALVRRGDLPGDQGNDVLSSLQEAERSVEQYVQAAEELIDSQMIPAHVVDHGFGSRTRTFRKLYTELEKLHGAARVPHEACGSSAKFSESGLVSTRRYHIAVQPARVWQAFPKQAVIDCARGIASVLKAPDVVSQWIDFLEIEKADCPALGFGVDEDEEAAKIYVLTRAHEKRIPNLPVTSQWIHDVIPKTTEPIHQMVALEWKMFHATNSARLRHYINNRELPVNDRLPLPVVATLHPRPVTHGTATAELKQGLLGLQNFTRAEIEIVSSADIVDGVLTSQFPEPSKLGFQFNTKDEDVFGALQRLLSGTVLEKLFPQMRDWVADSRQLIPHPLTNAQMGHDRRGDSYISIYRHPNSESVLSLAALSKFVTAQAELRGATQGLDLDCQAAFNTLRTNITHCNHRRIQDHCPAACDELIQNTFRACHGGQLIRRRRGQACAKEEHDGGEGRDGEANNEARADGAVGAWQGPLLIEDIVSTVELWGPPGCSIKHGNPYSYLPAAIERLPHDCRSVRGLGAFAFGSLLCGPETCYPECKAALVFSCSACSTDGPPLCFPNEPCCDADAARRLPLTSEWVLNGGGCGSDCAAASAARAESFECRARLCAGQDALNRTTRTGQRQCVDARGRGIKGEAGDAIVDDALCARIGGRAGPELSCGDVADMLAPRSPMFAHPQRCDGLQRRLRAAFAGKCCLEAQGSEVAEEACAA